MKRRLITVAICLIVALIPACLIAIGASKYGLIPESLEKYDDSLRISTPSGSEFSYLRGEVEYSAITAALTGAAPSDRETAEASAEEYRRFDLKLEGKRQLSLSLYLSTDAPCGFIATSTDKYYRIGGEALLQLFKLDAFACLWVGNDPPAATLEGVSLKTSVVEWRQLLSDGVWVSSGEYVSRSPIEYKIASHKMIEPSFAVPPTSTRIVAFDSDGATLFEGTAEELLAADLPTDRQIGIMYSAEWQRGGGELVRAAYAFRIPSAATAD